MNEELRVYMPEDLEADQLERLRASLRPEVHLSPGPDLPHPADYQIIVGGRITVEMLSASPSLRTVIIPWAGVPVKLRELLLGYPKIAVHNLHYNAPPTAEMAIALLLASAKSILPLDRKLREGDWQPRFQTSEGILLSGKTAVILGLGEIGSRVAAVCHAMGMRVIGVRRDVSRRVNGVDRIVSPDILRSVLPEANALIVTLPLTDGTRGLIGERELRLLPDQAIVVNVARGPIIQEEPLYNELMSGRIRAGIDVWYNYPEDNDSRGKTLPSKSPFHVLPNVVMTPHVGGDSDRSDALWVAGLRNMLNLAVEGAPIPNRVDLDTGY